jgi:hypothetical protein
MSAMPPNPTERNRMPQGAGRQNDPLSSYESPCHPRYMQASVIVWDLETVPDLAGFAAANCLAEVYRAQGRVAEAAELTARPSTVRGKAQELS